MGFFGPPADAVHLGSQVLLRGQAFLKKLYLWQFIHLTQAGHDPFSLFNRQVDPTTGTFKVGALFANPGARLRPGQFAKIRATLNVAHNALLVPQRAVSEIQGRYLVAVVGAGNTIELRPVTPGERVASDWIISAGLKAGETIVVEGTQKVRPGAVVTPRPFAPAATATHGAAAPDTGKPAQQG